MPGFDIKRERKDLYAPKNRQWQFLDVPEQHYLAIDGTGDPNTAEAYARAVEALYSVAYTVKFAGKHDGKDFVVGPLEGLWWADDMTAFARRAKQAWNWTMLINQPPWVSAEMIAAGQETALAKKKNPVIEQVRRFTLDEGLCAQVLHIGSYDDEAPVLHHLHHDFLPAQGMTMRGLHHEIYLSDPRRVEPAKLKTILRQPVSPA